VNSAHSHTGGAHERTDRRTSGDGECSAVAQPHKRTAIQTLPSFILKPVPHRIPNGQTHTEWRSDSHKIQAPRALVHQPPFCAQGSVCRRRTHRDIELSVGDTWSIRRRRPPIRRRRSSVCLSVRALPPCESVRSSLSILCLFSFLDPLPASQAGRACLPSCLATPGRRASKQAAWCDEGRGAHITMPYENLNSIGER